MARTVRGIIHTSLKTLFHFFGLEILRLKNVPRETLMGLRHWPINTVIDCGANQGQFARHISRFFPAADIYCFEPLKDPFQRLTDWAGTQGGRVRCFNVALGDREGEAIMYHHIAHSPSSSLLLATEHEKSIFPQTRQQAEVTVTLTTLDLALSGFLDKMLPEILLKLDVQGYEDRVLRGAASLLERVKACLLEACVDPMYKTQASFKELVVLLGKHGFVYGGNLDQIYGEDGRIMWFDALFIKR